MRRTSLALVAFTALASCEGAVPASGGASEPASGRELEAVSPERRPLPAPALVQSDDDRASFVTVRARPNAIPVLLFHGICAEQCSDDDIYSLPRAELARMFLMLRSAGYTTISAADYSRFLHGDSAGLPARPVLVTFDDGRLDAYRLGDSLLQALDMQAVMYVITANAETAGRFVGWPEMKAAAASGRWSIQLHADGGHVKIPADRTAELRPAYAVRRYDAALATEGHLETHDAWRERTEGDLARGEALLRAELPGHYRPISFAVPFGNYGQLWSNDTTIARELRDALDARFEVWFTQPTSNPDFTSPDGGTHERYRYTVLRSTTASKLYRWLDEHARM